MTAGVTAVVAQTATAAKRLADDLGIDTRWVFGARSADSFEGLRASLVLVDADADIPPAFMDTIRATVLKMPGSGGRVKRVSVTDAMVI